MNRPNRLLQLLRDNAAAPRAFDVKAEGEEATIYLYDAIDEFFGLRASDFVRELNALTAQTIHLRINSPGGSAFDARAIATAVQQHRSKVVAHIDGVAASAATIVALAAREVEMSEGAFFMIHQAWAVAIGNTNDMLLMADLLEKADDSLAADYARKTGKPKDEIAAMMAAETWFTAQEAKDAGFVDRIADAQAVEAHWNLAAYSNAPKQLTEDKPKPEKLEARYEREQIERRFGLYNRIAA